MAEQPFMMKPGISLSQTYFKGFSLLMALQKFNSIQFLIIYVMSQQPQRQLQTQHSTDIHKYLMDTHIIKSRVN
jgi:hypothetical protein